MARQTSCSHNTDRYSNTQTPFEHQVLSKRISSSWHLLSITFTDSIYIYSCAYESEYIYLSCTCPPRDTSGTDMLDNADGFHERHRTCRYQDRWIWGRPLLCTGWRSSETMQNPNILISRTFLQSTHVLNITKHSFTPLSATTKFSTIIKAVMTSCKCAHISVSKWYIVGHLSDALWDLWDQSVRALMWQSVSDVNTIDTARSCCNTFIFAKQVFTIHAPYLTREIWGVFLSLIYVLPLLSPCCVQYRVIPDRVITRPDYINCRSS